MERFYAIPNTPVFLGRVGENKAREIAFDISQWLAVYGEGSVQLMARRAGETVMYPVPLTRDGNLAIWTVTAGDVAKAGRTGECELSYTPDSDTLVKSESWSTSVLPSMAGGVVDAPEAAKAWIDALRKESAAVEQLAGDAEESAKEAAKSAVTAGSMAAASAKSAEAAAGSASEAKTEKTAAQKAAVQATEASQHYPFPHEGTGTWWVWDVKLGKYVNTGLTYGGSTGTEDHRKLANLEAPNQHPITAIAGLSGRLSALSTAIDNVDEQVSSLSEEIVTTSESKVSAHNTGTDTHSDIRLLIQGLTDRLNTLADSDDTTLDQLSEVVAYIKSNRGLIDAITTSKVSVSDIVDNLTTNVANKPLSAAQGVALKALIDAITVPDKLPNPNALTFTGAVTGSYDGSAPLEVAIPSGGGASGDYIPVPATAKVGQTIVVKAVNENGKPTEWEPVELPNGLPKPTGSDVGKVLIAGKGGTAEWGNADSDVKLIYSNVLTEAVSSIIINKDPDGNALSLSRWKVCLRIPPEFAGYSTPIYMYCVDGDTGGFVIPSGDIVANDNSARNIVIYESVSEHITRGFFSKYSKNATVDFRYFGNGVKSTAINLYTYSEGKPFPVGTFVEVYGK